MGTIYARDLWSGVMMNETQEQIDKAYNEGKTAFRRDNGTHGPTLASRAMFYSPNPYVRGTKLREAWQRGYNQDTRRIIAHREAK